ncbi:hypothetical protein [Mucilaginibacter aquaedulcis]|uniref:hypothetical protein n=1 Tax=Mucilaginibacter aquaedulcis TaxID=1187081 RepID=UPI0025B52178|nr:hypothetical protein [Mucilaginibacter aquaedulcis]MDN3551608.1 hypothetical protein [Mucilaginibacter aquaedulcis]
MAAKFAILSLSMIFRGFKIGQLVTLKSEGIFMRVYNIKDGVIKCGWYDENKILRFKKYYISELASMDEYFEHNLDD